jgi:hypothetical protein
MITERINAGQGQPGISNRPLDTAVADSQHATSPIPNRVEILSQPR